MHISFAGKVALVTGSTGGIGLAIARGLAAAGAETIVNGRSKDKVDRTAAELRRALPEAKVRGIAADVADAAGCDTLIKGRRRSISSSTTPAFSSRRISSRFRIPTGRVSSRLT